MNAQPVPEQSDLLPLLPSNGWDEMNLAEIPFFVLTDRVSKNGQTCIKHECTIHVNGKPVVQKWIVNGSQEYGLPTAADARTYLALLRLTEEKNDFTDPRVDFTRLELINLLGLPNEGRTYQRLTQSLLRLRNLSFDFENSWWDQKRKKLTTCSFSLLSDLNINDSRATDDQGSLFRSEIRWSQTIFDSLRAGFLRTIDYKQCIEFENNTALQMYRFLGKRFYKKPVLCLPLDEFAYHRVGLATSNKGKAQIVRKLLPGLRELETIGFIETCPDKERFIKKEGAWHIVLAAGPKVRPDNVVTLDTVAPAEAPAPSPVEQALIDHGVTGKVARELVQAFPAERIEAKIDILEWLSAHKPGRVKEPGAWLVKAIKDDFAPPKGYESKAEREAKAKQAAEAERKAAEERRRKAEEEAKEKAQAQAIRTYWEGLTSEEQEQFDAEALAAANAEIVATYQSSQPASMKSMYFRNAIREPFLRQRVAEQATVTS